MRKSSSPAGHASIDRLESDRGTGHELCEDRKVLKRINTLIHDIDRGGNEGIGKPEPPRHGFQGYWSRRITDEHG